MKLRILVSWLRSAGGDQSWKKAAGKSCRVLGGDQTVVVLWVVSHKPLTVFFGVSEGMVWKESGKGWVTMSSRFGKPSSGVSKGRRTKCDMEARDSATKPGAGKVLDCPGKRISPFRVSDGEDTRVGLQNEENRTFSEGDLVGWFAGLAWCRATAPASGRTSAEGPCWVGNREKLYRGASEG